MKLTIIVTQSLTKFKSASLQFESDILNLWYMLNILPISPFDLCSFFPVWPHGHPETLLPISPFIIQSHQPDLSLFFSFSWKPFTLPRTFSLWPCSSLFCLRSSPLPIYLSTFSWPSFSDAVSAARWARSLSLLHWSFRSLAVGDSMLIHTL